MAFPYNKEVRAQVAQSVLSAVIPALLIVVVIAIIGTMLGGAEHVHRYIPIAVATVLLWVDWLMFRRRRIMAAAHFFIILVYVACLTGMVFNGGVRSASFSGLLALMAVVGWFYSARGAFFFWIVTILTGATFVYLDGMGVLPAVARLSPVMIWVYVVGFQVMVLTACSIPSRMLHLALAESNEKRLEVEAANRAIQEREQYFRDVFDFSSDAIFIQDAETGAILDVNHTVLEMYGWERDQIAGASVADFSAGDARVMSRLAAEKMAIAAEQGSAVFEWIGKRKDGQEMPVEVALKLVTIGGCTRLVAMVRDISERKETMHSMQQRNALSHLIGDIATRFVGAQVDEFELRVQEALHQVALFLGANVGRLILYDASQRQFEVMSAWSEVECAARYDALSRLRAEQLPWWLGQMQARRVLAISDVEAIPAEGRAEYLLLKELGVQAFLDVPVFAGERLAAVLSFWSVEQERLWSDDEMTMLRFLGSILLGALERRKSELENEQLQEQMRQAQKMDAVGNLAGGVAHDFNNMLGAILGSVEVLDEYVADQGKNYLAIVARAANQAADLTKQLLAFSRKGEVGRTPVDLHLTVEGVVALLERSLDKRIRIIPQLEAVRAQVTGERSQLQSVLLNLGINAGHAMPEGGDLMYRTSVRVVEEEECRYSAFELRPGRYVCVEVIDSGEGIAPELMDKIFDPFFTTKPSGQGTGLGLSMAYGVIRDHQGAITVESVVGRGSVFTILLPLSDEAQPAAEAPTGGVMQGEGLVLVVDDEEMVRISMEAMLQRMGFEVLVAEGGAEALDMYKARGQEISLIILDMMMPEMTGREVFEQLLKMNPAVRCVLSSGFSREEDLNYMLAHGLRGHIRKPFQMRDLGVTIAQALR